MKAIVISDTHIPLNARDIPEQLWKQIKASDMIIHAGDIAEEPFYEKLASLKPIEAVSGNMDSYSLKSRLEVKRVLSIAGKRIGLVHGAGAPYNILDFVKSEFSSTHNLDAVIYGHSHKPDITTMDGIVYMNPGSPTDKMFAPYNSYILLDISEDGLDPHIIRL